ncbi:acetyl-CoA carboxylase biotin carboxylase subunit family protein [Amycolatopsis sp. NPDC058278]|uniref:ATP-grasp domain-containing protein n=1 Tax=Amycolatopsis sp. NPDC058278 TaxID=3346417 RepID=UPI0036DBE27F
MSTPKPAVVLFGGLAVAWNQRYLRVLAECGIAALIVDRGGPHAEALLSGDLSHVAGFAAADPEDHAVVADVVAGWAERFAVVGVACLVEQYVLPAAIAADLLGVPSPGLRAATVCRDKHLQRRFLAEWSPRSQRAGSGEPRFPVILKPAGRLASSGVRFVPDAAGLETALAEYGPDEVLLLEEPVRGPEFSVESLSVDGVVGYAEITGKRTTGLDSGFFVELGHTTPAPGLDEPARAALLDTHHAVLDRLGFGTGVAHAEYRLDDSGRPVLIEIAARPPGDSIMALHWLATGVSLEEAYLRAVLGEPAELPPPTRVARQVYLDHPAGVLTDVEVAPELGVGVHWFSPGEVHAQIATCAERDDDATVRCVLALKPSGTELVPLRESGDRAAMFVIDAPSVAELDELERRCRAGVRVRAGS